MIDLILNPPQFLVFALVGGVLISIFSAPLGVFMVWQRQSYFGATLAHSALLGVSLGLLFQTDLTTTVIVTSLLVALFVYFLLRKTQLSSDTLLGLMAHSSLAAGLVLLGMQKELQIDVMNYLVGDILSITSNELWALVALGGLIGYFFLMHWKDLLNITLNKELAQVEGVAYHRVQLGYTLLLALMIAFAMKVVGVLLITSLLIIPAAAARRFASTPIQMVFISMTLGLVSVLLGFASALYWDLPTGPAIVMAATALFLLSLTRPAEL